MIGKKDYDDRRTKDQVANITHEKSWNYYYSGYRCKFSWHYL